MMDNHVPQLIKQFEILQTVQERGIGAASYIFNLPKLEVENLVYRDIEYHSEIFSYHENILGSLNKRLEEAEADVRTSCWICGSDDGHLPRDCKEVRFIPSYMLDSMVSQPIGKFEIIQTVHHRGIQVAGGIFNLPIAEVKKIVLREIDYHTGIVKSHKDTLDILNTRLRQKDMVVRSNCFGSEGRQEEEKEEDDRSNWGSDDEYPPPTEYDHMEVRFIPFRGVPCYKCGKVGHLATVCKQVWSRRA